MPKFVRITAVALALAGVGATTAACSVEDPPPLPARRPRRPRCSRSVHGPRCRESPGRQGEAKAKAARAVKPCYRKVKKGPCGAYFVASKVRSGKIAMGMTPAQVKRIVGAPEDTDSMSSEFMGETTTMTNWSWTSDILSDREYIMVSLSFTDGKLDSKSVM